MSEMTSQTRPPLLTLLALLFGVEALGVSAYALWYTTQLFVAEVGAVAGAIFLCVLFVGMAVWLWFLTIALFRVRTSSRAGTLVWQTIQVVVGVSMINAEGDWLFVAIAMIVLGIAGGALLFSPSVTAVIARQRG
jgi:hypothetical protein